MSDFITDQLVVLENLARVLNAEDHPPELPELGSGTAAEKQAAVAEARTVVEAAQGTAYPEISRAAAAAFDALASGEPLEYRASPLRRFRRGEIPISPDYRSSLVLVVRSQRGYMAAWLAAYFLNPYRERLRLCQQCHRWFVDVTRNKSALRCSKACTIAWSNRQRPTKGGA